MTPEQASYVACAIDGEGTITVGQYMGMCRLQVSVFNSCLEFLEFIQTSTEQGTIRPHSKRVNKQVYGWRVQSDEGCKLLLTTILPYMIIKRKQAILALAILECSVPRNYADSTEKTRSQMKQNALALKLKALNHVPSEV